MAGRKTVARPERKRLAALLAIHRERLGLSQRELSRRVGFHYATLHRIETGQRGIDIAELVDLAAELKQDPIELLRLALSDEAPPSAPSDG